VYNLNSQALSIVDDPNGIGTTTINGINDVGNLVGFYVGGDDFTHGLLATAIPEPSPLLLALLAVPFAGLRWAMKRRRPRSRPGIAPAA
jgi:hypothetical protein